MNLLDWNPFKESDIVMPFNSIMPKVNVYQTKENVIIKAEVPGIKKEDIDVFANDNYIKISGTKKSSDMSNNEEVYKSESFYGSFCRNIALPSEINIDSVTAKCTDGILSISATKALAEETNSYKVKIT